MNPGKGSLARRLMVGQSFVVLGMTMSIVVAAFLIGPAVFDDHMRQAGHGNQPDVLEHAQEAFFSAGLQSIGVGLLVAAVGALAVSLVTTRRLGRWLNALTGGASRVSAGHYDEPVMLEGSSSELERVADAFNSMASQIETTESRRRTLLTDVAHELRTPIAAMDVTLEALEDGVLAPGMDAYATLRSQSARLARLACDIRDVSAAEEGRQRLTPRLIATSELVDSCMQQWRHRCEEAAVTLNTPDGGPEVLVNVDPARVGQVFDNLLANALRHTEPGGHITVRTRALGGGVAIDVMDDGEGMSPEALLHVMERFYRADPARTHADGSGTGVGLAISQAIARAHGGDLTAFSEGLWRGSTLTLSLPSSPNLHRFGA